MGAHGAGVEASYDAVGRYRQDDVNGFPRELIDRMLEAAALERASAVLDAMAGDGNLTARLHAFCRARGIALPKTTVLEFSRVQAEFAKKELAGTGAAVIWGDVLAMKGLEDGLELAGESFDRVLVKSSNHEIPLADQPRLYESLFRVLRPGGLYVNLGITFDTAAERDELRGVARVKDTFAGMTGAVRNRHFLTREELYGYLGEAGFMDVRAATPLEYVIRSEVVAEQYFPEATRLEADLAHQAAQAKAYHLRRGGRVTFEGASSVMRLPGEITVARRPSLADANARTFREYPMDFLRHVRVHAAMLEEAARHVAPGDRVLDVGCGIGLLAERLSQPGVAYTGLDVSADFIQACRRRFAGRPGFAFETADAAAAELGEGRYDAITLLNVLNLPGVDPAVLLRKARAALRPGGRLVVAGPASAESFAKIEDRVLAQLQEDGKVDGFEAEIQGLREANRRLLTGHGHYWSVEGMVALLGHHGYGRIRAASNGLYYGASYLVVAERPAASLRGGAIAPPPVEAIFQRSLSAHLPIESFSRLAGTTVLLGGLGGGSNIAELLVRKGVGGVVLADPDVYEAHNIRQRGSLASTWGRPKVDVMRERLLDVNPHANLLAVAEGVTMENAKSLVGRSDYVVDMLDFHALPEKVELYRAARQAGKTVLTAPSVVNGAVLYVFTPDGPTFEEFFGYDPALPPGELALRFLKRLITRYPSVAPEAVYQAAARGERTIPLDAVGVDQAAVLTVAALESLVLGRADQVLTVPRGLHVDLSDPGCLARILDFSAEFGGRG